MVLVVSNPDHQCRTGQGQKCGHHAPWASFGIDIGSPRSRLGGWFDWDFGDSIVLGVLVGSWVQGNLPSNIEIADALVRVVCSELQNWLICCCRQGRLVFVLVWCASCVLCIHSRISNSSVLKIKVIHWWKYRWLVVHLQPSTGSSLAMSMDSWNDWTLSLEFIIKKLPVFHSLLGTQRFLWRRCEACQYRFQVGLLLLMH